MERMRIADVEEDIDHELVSKEQIDAKIHEMAALASEDYRDKNPLLVAVLKGAVNTLVAFTQAMSIPVQIDFMSLSSYGSGTVSSGEVTVRQDLSADVRGRHILIVEELTSASMCTGRVGHLRDHGRLLARLHVQRDMGGSRTPRTLLFSHNFRSGHASRLQKRKHVLGQSHSQEV